MIRLILVVLAVVLYLIFSIPVLSYLKNLEKKDPKAAAKKSLDLVRWILGIVRDLAGITYEVRGLEHIPSDRAVLYVGNHRSYFDVVLTYARCPGLTGYVAKDSMKKIPLLSSWMKRLHCLFLNRSDIKEGLKTILQGIDQMKNGVSMCIFPEGTRNEASDDTLLLPFKEGSLKMAEKTGYPIIPMSINNTRNIFEAHRPFIRSAHVVLEYGEPIYPKDLPKEQKKFLGAHCQEIIQNTISKNQSLV